MLNKSKKILLLSLVIFICLVVGLTIHKFTQNRTVELLSMDKASMQQHGVILFDKPRRFKIPNLQTTQKKPLQSKFFKNKWTFLYFGFTHCPDVCPAALSKLKNLNDSLKTFDSTLADRSQYLIVSVDPGRDTIQSLKDYLNIFDPSFIGVLGDPKETSGFSKQFNVMYSKVEADNADSDDYQIDHSAQVIIINPQGDYQGYIRPNFEVSQLLPALKTLNRVLGYMEPKKESKKESKK